MLGFGLLPHDRTRYRAAFNILQGWIPQLEAVTAAQRWCFSCL